NFIAIVLFTFPPPEHAVCLSGFYYKTHYVFLQHLLCFCVKHNTQRVIIGETRCSLMDKFGGRLRYLRTRKKLRQEDLAKELQISKSAVGMYERNEREPSFELVQKIANYF